MHVAMWITLSSQLSLAAVVKMPIKADSTDDAVELDADPKDGGKGDIVLNAGGEGAIELNAREILGEDIREFRLSKGDLSVKAMTADGRIKASELEALKTLYTENARISKELTIGGPGGITISERNWLTLSFTPKPRGCVAALHALCPHYASQKCAIGDAAKRFEGEILIASIAGAAECRVNIDDEAYCTFLKPIFDKKNEPFNSSYVCIDGLDFATQSNNITLTEPSRGSGGWVNWQAVVPGALVGLASGAVFAGIFSRRRQSNAV